MFTVGQRSLGNQDSKFNLKRRGVSRMRAGEKGGENGGRGRTWFLRQSWALYDAIVGDGLCGVREYLLRSQAKLFERVSDISAIFLGEK